jgi:hypothetical protein
LTQEGGATRRGEGGRKNKKEAKEEIGASELEVFYWEGGYELVVGGRWKGPKEAALGEDEKGREGL